MHRYTEEEGRKDDTKNIRHKLGYCIINVGEVLGKRDRYQQRAERHKVARLLLPSEVIGRKRHDQSNEFHYGYHLVLAEEVLAGFAR